MLRVVTLLVLSISILMLTSCEEFCIDGNKEIVKQGYNVGDFTGIKLDIKGSVKLLKGKPDIEISSDKNTIDFIDVCVEDGDILHLKQKRGSCFSPSDVKINIYADGLKTMEINSDSDCESDSIHISPKITLNGSGKIILKGSSVNQELINNSSGIIDLTNMPTKNATIRLNGSGDIKAEIAKNATVVNRSSGDIYIYNISGVLNVTIQGSGNVYYSGTPSKIIPAIQASGKIIKM